VAHRAVRAEPEGLIVRDTLTGTESLVPRVNAVVALEPRSPVGAELAAEASAPRTFVIGDAYAPRGIDAAIFEAVELAYDVAGLAALRP
jgi:hypothetical protein